MGDKDFETKGEKVDKILVEINYRIIELFSAGLYSSPNKAFEELVSNSYDADADKVAVYLSEDLESEDAILWVCDNGTSMDGDGLKLLWKIGETNKTSPEYNGKRNPIGQFGIGKLSTYVLAHKLTHICKHKGKYLAVTMNYHVISDSSSNNGIATKQIFLNERELTEAQVKEILEPIIKKKDVKLVDFNLWGDNAEDSWTMAIMSDLREKGKSIKEGRLEWILCTALPINPGFNLLMNGRKLEPSKFTGKIIKEWTIGENDDIAKREKHICREEKGKHYVDLPTLKNVKGKLTLYENTLTGGKSEKWGHSHGIFLMIRNRLINTDNPLLNNMEELHHATFNRIRFEIHADELNKFLTSPRESVQDSIEYQELITYIKQKFFKAKATFDEWCKNRYPAPSFADKISNISPFYSKIPIYESVRKCFNKEINCPTMIKLPENISEKEEKEILAELDASITNPEDNLIEDYSLDNDLKVEDPIAKLNLKEKKIEINTRHPFYIAFLSELKGKSNLPFTLIATNEIFTEATLIEKDVDQVSIQDILQRRDEMLREFCRQGKPNIFVAVTMLKNSLNDEKGLEEALHYCFDCLGFEVEPMALKGTAEGKATARLGMWEGKKQDYSFTYEAKSTKKDKIKADAAKTGVVNLHRKKHKANFALEVAIDYEGANNENSNVNQLAKDDHVTLVRARDLWTLMIHAIPNQLNFLRFKEFLKDCKSVKESSEWIDKFCKKKIKKKPYREILDAIWEIFKNDPREAPSLESIRFENKDLKKYNTEELKEMINTLQMIMPHLINIENNKVRILLPPEKILESLNETVEKQLPQEFKEKFSEVFKNNLDES
ncbi:ATP-binding protein [Candidatus Woesearchaeota archaeon]|nr:ATP-binding protein [Candidatus Woesearchaeota archaeon]